MTASSIIFIRGNYLRFAPYRKALVCLNKFVNYWNKITPGIVNIIDAFLGLPTRVAPPHALAWKLIR